MNSVYFYTLIIVMLTYSIFRSAEKPISLKKSIYVFLVEGILLLPLWSSEIIFLFLFLLVLNVIIYRLEKTELDIHLSRFLVFLFYAFFLASITGNNQIIESFNPAAAELFQNLSRNNLILNMVNQYGVQKILIFLAGILIITNEVNNFIRYILHLLKVEPNGSGDNPDQQYEENNLKKNEELKRGKIIGIIERILIFVFTISDNFAAIGFILAAKGFTRFRELDNRNFAEYVLIGTLLSTSLSILCGLLFRGFLM